MKAIAEFTFLHCGYGLLKAGAYRHPHRSPEWAIDACKEPPIEVFVCADGMNSSCNIAAAPSDIVHIQQLPLSWNEQVMLHEFR